MEHVGDDLAGHVLLQLASSQICQNALQLADDMYAEVIYLSIFLWYSYSCIKHITLLPGVELLVLLLCRERCSSKWILPLCYLLLNLSCVRDNNTLTLLLIFSTNVSFNWNLLTNQVSHTGVAEDRQTPQCRTNCGTHITSVSIFKKRNSKTDFFFVSLLLKKSIHFSDNSNDSERN